MNAVVPPILALGRVLIALIFIRGGINKLGALAATSAQMASHGIPFADVLVWGAIAMELGVGLMLAAGLYARWAALALFFYTLTLATIFHGFWAETGQAARTDASFFFGHLSMMGGMLYVVVFGAGACSIDKLMRRWTAAPAFATEASRR